MDRNRWRSPNDEFTLTEEDVCFEVTTRDDGLENVGDVDDDHNDMGADPPTQIVMLDAVNTLRRGLQSYGEASDLHYG